MMDKFTWKIKRLEFQLFVLKAKLALRKLWRFVYPLAEPIPEAKPVILVPRFEEPEKPKIKGQNVLFVCTGNTCRSPMAVVLAEWQRDFFLTTNLFGRENLRIATFKSAGLSVAVLGEAASKNAKVAMNTYTENALDGHKATPVTQELVDWADLIVGMTRSHTAQVRSRFDTKGKHVMTLASAAGQSHDVLDPFGGSVETYTDCAAQMHRLIRQMEIRLADGRLYNAGA